MSAFFLGYHPRGRCAPLSVSHLPRGGEFHACLQISLALLSVRKCRSAPSLFGNGLLFKFHRWKGKPARYMVEFKKNRFTIGNDHQFNTLSDLIEVWND